MPDYSWPPMEKAQNRLASATAVLTVSTNRTGKAKVRVGTFNRERLALRHAFSPALMPTPK